MKPRSWRFWIFCTLIFLGLFCVVLFSWAAYQFQWDWVGFNGGFTKITIHGASNGVPQDEELPQTKTLWDWLQLLIVPFILAAGAGVFTWWSARTERKIADKRSDQEQEIAEKRYAQEQTIADQRYKQDQELALDKQRQDLLQAYLDRMTELLLEKGLRKSEPESEVRKVARTRTISTLNQLDGKRALIIFLFLEEARLKEAHDPIISLANADLSSAKWSESDLGGINLSGINLRGADLSGANLSKANLIGANLVTANLERANLSGANLDGADLSGADLTDVDLTASDLRRAYLYKADLTDADLTASDLRRAYLYKADLTDADLSGANLSGADLDGANLSGANLERANLSGANLDGADLSGANLSEVRHLDKAPLGKTVLYDVIGLSLEQRAHCKAHGALVGVSSQESHLPDSVGTSKAVSSLPVREAMPEAASSQEISQVTLPTPTLQTSPLSDQVVTSNHLQEATSGASESFAVEKEATPSMPQEDALSTQRNATTPLSSQDAAS